MRSNSSGVPRNSARDTWPSPLRSHRWPTVAVERQVTWQELGEDFAQHKFRFQVLDEGEYQDHSWRDDLQKILREA